MSKWFGERILIIENDTKNLILVCYSQAATPSEIKPTESSEVMGLNRFNYNQNLKLNESLVTDC